ncbi:hypothetical protein Fcan01_24599 [Folsomia candida]|uniref:Uncharacterized protein n=1 Tax=Folsomia candida TaxID=158441 RepID=A0A226D5A0_FOLCA|nr:hypothetical protein Fcan01_24599 [Folsomia candida]
MTPKTKFFLVLLAHNLSTNLFTQLTISDSGKHSGPKNFWDYLTKLEWGRDSGKLANSVNRKLEKAPNYAYCTEHAHLKIPLKSDNLMPDFSPSKDEHFKLLLSDCKVWEP